jgi:hypothetical protein
LIKIRGLTFIQTVNIRWVLGSIIFSFFAGRLLLSVRISWVSFFSLSLLDWCRAIIWYPPFYRHSFAISFWPIRTWGDHDFWELFDRLRPLFWRFLNHHSFYRTDSALAYSLWWISDFTDFFGYHSSNSVDIHRQKLAFIILGKVWMRVSKLIFIHRKPLILNWLSWILPSVKVVNIEVWDLNLKVTSRVLFYLSWHLSLNPHLWIL